MSEDFSTDELYMGMALREAERGAAAGEVPCGAVIVKDDLVIGKAHNQTETLKDPTAHAEILAITQAAAALENWRLTDAVMYVTKEPCPMCAGGILQARVPAVVWGAADPKAGAVCSLYELFNDSRLNHRVEHLGGVLADECGRLLSDFFRSKR